VAADGLLVVALVVVAVVAIAGAVVLEATGHDSAAAWAGFSSAIGVLVGRHITYPPDDKSQPKG
jgi:hypothetical protein